MAAVRIHVWVVVVCLVTVRPAAADSGAYVPARWKTYGDAVSAWYGYDARCKALEVEVPGLIQRFNDERGRRLARHSALNARLQQLLAEKQQGMNEFRKGLRCSKCGKTQTELGGPEKFRAHLGEVKGTPLPPTPQEIANKEREYDAKIAPVQRELLNLIDNENRAEAAMNKAQSERQRVCELRNAARSAALQLKPAATNQQSPKQQSTGSRPGPYRCEDFPDELRTRIAALDGQIATAQRNVQVEQAAAKKYKAKLAELQQQLKAETDRNRREIVQQSINASQIAAKLHDDQARAFQAKVRELTSRRDSAAACLARAQ